MGRALVEDVTAIQFGLFTVVGAVVGLIAGMFGIGGGFLIVPVLNIALGLPMQIAVGSAACQVLGPATTSVLARRVTRDDLRLPLIVGGGLFIGVFAGATLLHHLMTPLPGEATASAATTGETVILLVYLLLLIALGGFGLWECAREMDQRPIRIGWLTAFNLPPRAAVEGNHPSLSIPVVAWFGLGVGFLSGLLGISGGLLLLPGFIYLFGFDFQRAATATMLIVWLVAVQSTIAHSLHDHIRLSVVLALLLGGTIGARLGVDWGRRLSSVRGRQSFGWLALATAAMIGVKLATSP